jgi:hypothetical protein
MITLHTLCSSWINNAAAGRQPTVDLVVILIMEQRQMTNKSHSYPFTSLGAIPVGGNHELAE